MNTVDEQLVSIALQIAWNQRRETQIQPLETIIEKFKNEERELEEELNRGNRLDALSEIADLYYYDLQARHHKSDVLSDRLSDGLSRAGFTVEQAQKAALAKYRLRVSVSVKDKDAEREALRALL